MPMIRVGTEERAHRDSEWKPDKALLKSRKPAFDWLDKNQDAAITREDLINASATWGIKLSKQEATDVIDAFDVDRDGKLSTLDYARLLGYDMDTEHAQELRDVFDLFDTDSDGFLVKDDIKKLFKCIGESSEKASTAFKAIDAHKKKKISFDDFLDMMFH